MRHIQLSRFALLLPLIAALVSSACDADTTVPTPVVDQVIETHTGPLDPRGTNTYLFTLGQAATAQVMLAGALVDNPLRSVPALLRVTMGVWNAADSVCVPIATNDVEPRLTAALHRQLDPGTYCASVTDNGSLDQPVGIVVRIVAPALMLTGAEPGTDSFSSSITNGGTSTRTFHVSRNGTVNVTLTSLSLANTQAGLGIGVLDVANGSCKIARTVIATAGTSPQISTQVDAGVYCVAVYDAGNFTAGQHSFSLTVQHP